MQLRADHALTMRMTMTDAQLCEADVDALNAQLAALVQLFHSACARHWAAPADAVRVDCTRCFSAGCTYFELRAKMTGGGEVCVTVDGDLPAGPLAVHGQKKRPLAGP